MNASPDHPPIQVLALSRTNPANHQTRRLRVDLLVEELRRRNVHVTVQSLPRGREKAEFFRSATHYDIVWLHRYTTWPWELSRLCALGQHLVLDIDDPVGYSASHPDAWSIARSLKFRFTARRSEAILAASDGLVELGRVHNRQTRFVPLCADPAAHSMQPRRRPANEPFRLLWVGSRSTFKYLEAIRPQLEAVGELAFRLELVVVAHAELRLERLRVHNVAWSPAAEREQFARCQVGLVPLSDDRWTRAKAALKPLQYLANGLPFIGSPVGVNRRLADDQRNGLLAATPEEWTSAVARLATNEDQRLRMGAQGVDYIRRYHSPEMLAAQVAEVFRELVGSRRPTNS